MWACPQYHALILWALYYDKENSARNTDAMYCPHNFPSVTSGTNRKISYSLLSTNRIPHYTRGVIEAETHGVESRYSDNHDLYKCGLGKAAISEVIGGSL
jgi:hypothetical protein